MSYSHEKTFYINYVKYEPDDGVDGAVEVGEAGQRQQVQQCEGAHRAPLHQHFVNNAVSKPLTNFHNHGEGQGLLLVESAKVVR